MTWAIAVLVTASAAGAVLLYTYVNVGGLGPLPNMYEPTWALPGKEGSAAAEIAGALLATTGLVLALRSYGRRGARDDHRSRNIPVRPGRRRTYDGGTKEIRTKLHHLYHAQPTAPTHPVPTT